MNAAPVLHATGDRMGQRLVAAFNGWREHYDVCPCCNAASWYEPDRGQLCTAGRACFDGWARLAHASVPTKGGAVAASPLRMRTYYDTGGV